MWDDLTHLAIDTIEGGGFVMVPLLLCAAALWYALGFRLTSLRRGTRLPLAALAASAEAPRGQGVLVEALAAGQRCLALPAGRRQAALRGAFDALAGELGRGAVLIQVIVVIAPLTGLLGTVSGMIETFDALADMALFSASGGGVAGGIAEALLSTQMGLAVAIPGLIVGRLLDRRQQRLTEELDELRNLLATGANAAGEVP